MSIPPDQYDGAVAKWIVQGVPEGLAHRFAADNVGDYMLVVRGRCPKCGCPMSRTEDLRQSGLTEIEGTWFNYRHNAESPGGPLSYSVIDSVNPADRCRYLFDRKEVTR